MQIKCEKQYEESKYAQKHKIKSLFDLLSL